MDDVVYKNLYYAAKLAILDKMHNTYTDCDGNKQKCFSNEMVDLLVTIEKREITNALDLTAEQFAEVWRED